MDANLVNVTDRQTDEQTDRSQKYFMPPCKA